MISAVSIDTKKNKKILIFQFFRSDSRELKGILPKMTELLFLQSLLHQLRLKIDNDLLHSHLRTSKNRKDALNSNDNLPPDAKVFWNKNV